MKKTKDNTRTVKSTAPLRDITTHVLVVDLRGGESGWQMSARIPMPRAALQLGHTVSWKLEGFVTPAKGKIAEVNDRQVVVVFPFIEKSDAELNIGRQATTAEILLAFRTFEPRLSSPVFVR